jgi:hypothetical protein
MPKVKGGVSRPRRKVKISKEFIWKGRLWQVVAGDEAIAGLTGVQVYVSLLFLRPAPMSPLLVLLSLAVEVHGSPCE